MNERFYSRRSILPESTLTACAATALVLLFVQIPEAQAQSAEDLIRQMRDLRNRDWYSHPAPKTPSGPTQAELDASAARARREKASALNNEGIAAWTRGDWGIAGEKFQQAYANNPDSKNILTNLANCRFQQGRVAWDAGDWEYSANNFRSAVLHNPGSEEFKKWLATAEQKVQEQRKLIQDARENHRRWNKAYPQYEQGLLSLKEGNWAAAEAQFKAAAQTYPAEPGFLKWVAHAKTKQGKQAWANDDFDLALAFYTAALETDPANKNALESVPKLITAARRDKELKFAAAQTAQETRKLSESLSSRPDSGGLGYDDLPGTTGAFGTKEANPTLTPTVPTTPGTNTKAGDQLKSAAAGAAAGEDLTFNYDVGGARSAGSLVDPRRFSERVRNDPRMVGPLKELTELNAKRSRLDAEREELIKQRNLSKDEAPVREISEKLERKEKEFQLNLKAIFDQERSIVLLKEKLHREIDTEVVGDPGVIPPVGADRNTPPAKKD